MKLDKIANRHIAMLLTRLDKQGEVLSNNTKSAIKAQFRKFKDDIEGVQKELRDERKL